MLYLDPSIRLHPTDGWVVPAPVIPDPIPVAELIALALTQRPEMGERRTVVREALLALDGARALPFSPTIYLGFSSGGFGGGSNLVRPIFGGFGGRSDFDAIAYWTLQNMGVGNLAMIKAANARLGVTQYQELTMLDLVRDEVAEAYAKTHARYQQILEDENAVRTGIRGFSEDLERIREAAGLPIEVLNNLRLKAESQVEYLDAIVDYNRAHFELYVALGQPPAACLARPVPTEGIRSPDAAEATSAQPVASPSPSAIEAGRRGQAVPPTAPAGSRSPFSPPLPNPPGRWRIPRWCSGGKPDVTGGPNARGMPTTMRACTPVTTHRPGRRAGDLACRLHRPPRALPVIHWGRRLVREACREPDRRRPDPDAARSIAVGRPHRMDPRRTAPRDEGPDRLVPVGHATGHRSIPRPGLVHPRADPAGAPQA